MHLKSSSLSAGNELSVSHAEARSLVVQLAKAAKVAENRISIMGGAVDKNFTVRLDGTPAAAGCAGVSNQ